MKIILLGLLTAFTLYSCGSPEPSEKEIKADKHQKALAAFNNAVKEFNEHIDILCECYKEAGDAYGCERKHGSLRFTATTAMEVLSDEEFNLDHVYEGNEKLKECKAEGLKKIDKE